MPTLDIYWSFRSPYSYLAIDRLVSIREEFAIDVHFRPVRPLAMREPDFFERGRKQFLPYLFRDAPREAARLGIPFSLPNPDPINMDMESGKVASEQPLLNRVMDLTIAAEHFGKSLDFAQALSRRIWSGEDWSSEKALNDIAASVALDVAALDAWITENSDEIQSTIARNEANQLEYHWGVPLMVLDGEPFFGQDRLDSLIWRLKEIDAKRQ